MQIHPLFICPYCKSRAVPAPPITPHPHATCEACGASPRAEISRRKTGDVLIRYVKDGRKPLYDAPLVQRSIRIRADQAVRFGHKLSENVRAALDVWSTENQAYLMRGNDDE